MRAPLLGKEGWPQAGVVVDGPRPESAVVGIRFNRPTLRVPPALQRRGAQINTDPHAKVV